MEIAICQCTSGRNNGAKYRTHGYNGYDIDCLDQGALRRYCGYPSSAKKSAFIKILLKIRVQMSAVAIKRVNGIQKLGNVQ